jgi:hypothetical protein
VLEAVDLPVAPPVLRGSAVPLRQRRAPAVVLLVLGGLLVLGPIAGGMFAKVASGNQLIDEFEPHLEADALARDEVDLEVLRRGAAAIDRVVVAAQVPEGEFPGVDQYRRTAAAIDGRASGLLDRIVSAEPDYRRVASPPWPGPACCWAAAAAGAGPPPVWWCWPPSRSSPIRS